VTLGSPHSATAAELKARIELEREGAPFLIYRDGDGHQRLLLLGEDRPRLTVGRSEACAVSFPWDAEASRVHAELERVGGGWALVDGGLSRNGSFRNGERLHDRRRLADGDVLRFGQTTVIYREPTRVDVRGQTETVLGRELPGPADVSKAQRAVLLALCRPFADGNAFAAPATNNQIAAELYLSLDSVKGHLRVLYSKFDVDHLPQNEKRLRLAERVLQSGVVTPADLRRTAT
jgi:hypothetical protein